jgi:cobalamin biosynthetic protein CobC
MTRPDPHPIPAGPADHGGGIDAAVARWGGPRSAWIDLSTGINPQPYPLPPLPPEAWTALPDVAAEAALCAAARRFWHVPAGVGLVAAPGTSALIARLPALAPPARVRIPGPTYNEHARAFTAQGWTVAEDAAAEALVLVHPNNPDGRLWHGADADAPFLIIDESFADVAPDSSLVARAARPGTIVLKGLGKFWGLAGLRLGFAIGDPALVARLASLLGPWPVSGPALSIGTAALGDPAWAEATRARLDRDATRLDALLGKAGAQIVGGTSLYRLAQTPDATAWQEALARRQIWTRRFPYSATWLRFGLPADETQWTRLTQALEDIG